MKTTAKFLRTALPAATLSIAMLASSGCGKPKAYAPLAPEGTMVAFVEDYRGLADNPMTLYVLDFCADYLNKIGKLLEQTGNAGKVCFQAQDPAAYKQRQLDAMRRIEWVAFTMAGPDFNSGAVEDDEVQISFPATAIVAASPKKLSFDDVETQIRQNIEECREMIADKDDGFDFEEIVTLFKENCEIKTAEIAGCQARVITVKETEKTAPILKKIVGFEPCYGLYAGRLLIAASSPAVFQDTVALYSGERAPSADPQIVADLSLDNPNYERFAIYHVSDFIKRFLSEEELRDLPENVKPYAESLETVRFTGRVDGAAMAVNASIDICLGDENLATALRRMIDGAMGLVSFFGAPALAKVPAAEPLLNIFERLSVASEKGTCSIRWSLLKDDLEKIDLDALSTQLSGLACNNGDEDDEDDGGEGFEFEEDDEDDADDGADDADDGADDADDGAEDADDDAEEEE